MFHNEMIDEFSSLRIEPCCFLKRQCRECNFPSWFFVHCGLEGLKRADLYYSFYHHVHLNWGQVPPEVFNIRL